MAVQQQQQQQQQPSIPPHQPGGMPEVNVEVPAGMPVQFQGQIGALPQAQCGGGQPPTVMDDGYGMG